MYYVYCICYSFMRHMCFYFDIAYIIIDTDVFNIVTILYEKLL